MRTFKFVIANLAIVVAAAPVWLAWEFSRPVGPLEAFDKHTWLVRNFLLTEPGDPGCVRGGMALDLIERKFLIGNLASDVTNLLGEPTGKGNTWTYGLGQCSGLGWYNSELVVAFDRNSRVSTVSFARVPGS